MPNSNDPKDFTTSENMLAKALERLEAKETSDTLQDLTAAIAKIAQDTAVHGERDHAITQAFISLKEDFKEIKAELATMKEEVSEIKDMANKWRGGLVVLMGLGGVLGSLVAFWDKVGKWLHQ